MKVRPLLTLTIVLALHGCAMLPQSTPAPARLDLYRERHFEPRGVTPLTVQGETVRAAYEAYLTAGGSEPHRQEALKRLTDLEVEGVLTAPNEGADYRGAIGRYDTLLAQNPAGAIRETLLYGLARACAQQGETERQLAVMTQLLHEFPHSPYRTELEFRSGEYLFAARRYGEAATFYEAVLSNQALNDYQERARYKLAWSHYRRHRYDDAVTRFLEMFRYRITPQLVAHGEAIEALPLSEGDRALLSDVVRGVALAASAGDGGDLAERFTTEEDEAYAYLVYGTLVERYVDQDRYHDAAETARGFVQRWPRHAAAPRLQLRLLEVIAMGGFTARLEQERADFVKRYHPQGEHWPLLSPAVRAQLVEPLQTTLIGLAQRQHAKAQQSRASDDYRKAIHWYHQFLDGFPAHPEAWRMSFLLGNALYEN
ncbi:MAG TPA: tetratricopeptide repeat protein, partial [Gammaproteobacteria bacterium]